MGAVLKYIAILAISAAVAALFCGAFYIIQHYLGGLI